MLTSSLEPSRTRLGWTGGRRKSLATRSTDTGATLVSTQTIPARMVGGLARRDHSGWRSIRIGSQVITGWFRTQARTPVYNTANKRFLRWAYKFYLQREPNGPPDNNFDGFNFWLTDLTNNYGGDPANQDGV